MMTSSLFILITLLTFACFYLGTGRDSKVLIFFSFWTLLTGAIALSGFLTKTDTFPPRILVVILPSVFYVIWFYRTIKAERINIRYLTALHIIRIPVELVLYRLYLEKYIPKLMTFEGWNYDIIMGMTAVLMLVYLVIKGDAANRLLLKIWNIIGIVLLGIIVSLAILSTPSPVQQLAFDQPNVAILHFPFTWLPAVVVPMVLLSHLLVLRWGRNSFIYTPSPDKI
jgi:hypothetical protein